MTPEQKITDVKIAIVGWIVCSILVVGHYWWIHKDNWQFYLDWELMNKYERADWIDNHPGMCVTGKVDNLPFPEPCRSVGGAPFIPGFLEKKTPGIPQWTEGF